MNEMVEHSVVLATQIRAVDVAEAVTLVLNAHFLPDVMGNLKSYATQRFRCKECGTSYRRPPLAGRCAAGRSGSERCDGELLSTVFEASVRKVPPALPAARGYRRDHPYVRQRIQILADSVATLFPGSTAQTTLDRSGPASGRARPASEGGAVA